MQANPDLQANPGLQANPDLPPDIPSEPFQLYQVLTGSLQAPTKATKIGLQFLKSFPSQKSAIAHLKDTSFIKAMRDEGSESAEFVIMNSANQFCLKPITIYKIDKLQCG